MQLWKAGEFKPKKVCKSPTKHFQGSSDFSCDCFNFDVKHLSNHTDSSCRNLFTQEVPGKVTRDVVISYEVVAQMTIFAKLFHFYQVSLICNIKHYSNCTGSIVIYLRKSSARGRELWSYIILTCFWWRSLRIFSIHNKYRELQCTTSW